MSADQDQTGGWYLEGYLDKRKTRRRWMVQGFPYRIGRHPKMDLCLPFRSVSGRHAEIYPLDEGLGVRDLGSTNGTFVNRQRIEEDTRLQEGDVLHFAECEFRVGRQSALLEASASATQYTGLSGSDLPEGMALGAREFKQMLLTQSVLPLFQPIVDLRTEARFGYEVLGRGDQEGLSAMPGELFRIAWELGLEAELSQLFRIRGIDEARGMEGKEKLFLNTHGSELGSPTLLPSLKALRDKAPQLSLVLEIHEAAVTDLEQMSELRSELKAMGIELAYDDFGAGQARLLELVEVPPDYVKFDLALIRGLHESSTSKRNMVESLVKVSSDIGVRCLAEGIENRAERELCLGLGFHLAQGFYYGRPEPLSHWGGA